MKEDYEWRQISMWDFIPENCISKLTRSGDHIFEFFLMKEIERHGNYRKWEVVTDLDYAKKCMDNKDATYYQVINRKSTLIKSLTIDKNVL